MVKVQYACTCIKSDGKKCGNLSTWRQPSQFKQSRENYRCSDCACNSPESKHHKSISLKLTKSRPEVKQRQSEAQKIAQNRPCVKEKRSKTNALPEVKQRRSEAQKLSQNRPEVKQRQSESAKIVGAKPDVKQRRSESQIISHNRPEVKQRSSEAQKLSHARPELRLKQSISGKISYEYPPRYEKHLIGVSGQGFWYGHPILCPENKKGKQYCELWNKGLWVRIDAAWDYKSAISEVTRWETPSKRQLSRHHVYWQEKACCVWDEDAQGYYAMIDLNHNKNKPNWYKHYIKGDPNKFVLLTAKEHGEVKGSKKSGKDTMWWVRYFEDLIEKRESEGKPCYLSKEDFEVYKVENAEKIAFYTKKPYFFSKISKILHIHNNLCKYHPRK
jgi:hypothetical protein